MAFFNIDVEHSNIYYEVYGKSGIPLVFIHGLLTSSSIFYKQVEYFKKFCKVIVIDLRGNGKSGSILGNKDTIIDSQVNDIKMLLDYLKVDNAIFLGVSYGGIIAQKILITHKELVKGLVIVDSLCDSKSESLKDKLYFSDIFNTLRTVVPKKIHGFIIEKIYKSWPIASNVLKNSIFDIRVKETLAQKKAVKKIDLKDELLNLSVPTLCIVGDYGDSSLMKMMQIISIIDKSKLYVLEEALEPSNLCQPEKFNPLVADFIYSLKRNKIAQ